MVNSEEVQTDGLTTGPVAVEAEKPVAWHCVGGGLGWNEDKIIRDEETAIEYAKRPADWNVKPLIYALSQPQGELLEGMVLVPRALVDAINQIKADLKDFDGDRRGHYQALQDAEEALIEAALAGRAAKTPIRPDRLDEFWHLRQRFPLATELVVEHDGFIGTVQGYYITREGHTGLVLQDKSNRVVHVYKEKWFHE